MTAVVTFVSSVKAATAGTTCKGKVDTQMLSEPHLPGPFLAYKCGTFKKEEASITYQAFRTVWQYNRHYSFTYTYQSANVFIYRFIHFQIHTYIYSFIKSFVHVRNYLLSELK